MEGNQGLTPAVREGIDACRVGHDDLRLPDLAEAARAVMENDTVASHFEQVQLCDARILGAITDVTVPEGLATRLLARLQSAQSNAVEAQSTVALPEPSSPHPVPSNRRRRMGWSMALAASLLLATSLIAYWSWRPAGPVDVVTLAEVWQGRLSSHWLPMTKAPKSPPPFRLAIAPNGWQPVAPYLGYRAVAYHVSTPQGGRAILFVVSVSPDKQLPKFPPRTPQFSSGGRAVAVWLTGKQMCMLVVDGDERAYRALIGAGQVPLA